MSAKENEAIAAAILALTAKRAPRTICPSEAARALSADDTIWRAMMPAVRDVAAQLASAGAVVVTQRGKPVDARTARGPIRIASPPRACQRGAAKRPESA